MNRVLLAISLFITMIFFTHAKFAFSYNQHDLEVDFVNNTKYACTVTDSHLKYGIWQIKPLDNIKAGGKCNWDVLQIALHGPDIYVTMKCGDYSFSVRNQQNLSALQGGNQHSTTFNVDKHLNVTNKQIQHASFTGQKPGIAQVTVSLKRGQYEFE